MNIPQKAQRSPGEEDPVSVIFSDDGWEEEGRQSYQGALGGGVRYPEFVSRTYVRGLIRQSRYDPPLSSSADLRHADDRKYNAGLKFVQCDKGMRVM